MTAEPAARGEIPPFIRRVLGLTTPRRFTYDGLVRVGRRRYLLASPEDVRHVLLSQAARYVKTPRLTSARGRRRAGHGVLTRTGDPHRERKRLLLPLFHREAVARFGPAIGERLERWLEQRSQGERLDLAQEMARLTRSAILSVLFGDDLDPAVRAHLEAAIGVRRRYTEVLYHGRLPGRERLPTPLVRAHRRAVREIDGAILGAVARRRGADGGSDLIGELLRARGSDGTPLTDDDVRDEALTFMSTGYETLGDGLAWTWYLLAVHPEEEERLHATIRGALGDRAPSAADLPGLDPVAACLDESLRLFPPTWIYARIPLAQDRLPSGARVAPGATLYVCPYLLHRHPHHYAEPERFDPRRFAAAGRSDRFVYLPFGDGPHRCLGENLARLEGVLVLARLAQRLRFELLGPDRVEPHGGITLTPKGGLPARVELR